MVLKKWVIALLFIIPVLLFGCKQENTDELPLIFAVVSPYENSATVYIGSRYYNFNSLSVSVNSVNLINDGAGNYDTGSLPSLSAGSNVTLLISGEENSRSFHVNVSAIVPTSATNVQPSAAVNWKYNTSETVTCTPGNGARTTYVVFDNNNANRWITSNSITSTGSYTFSSSKNSPYYLNSTDKVKVTVISSNKTYITDNTDSQSALVVEQENALQYVIRNTQF